MEDPDSLAATISVVLPAMLGWESLRPALDCWLEQTRSDQVEIVLVGPDADAAEADLPESVVRLACGSALLHEARAAGIRRSSGAYVFIAEDHCVPDRDFVSAILRSVSEGFELIGPALRPGNPETALGQAAFLLGYGEWLSPGAEAPTHRPGHNVAVRRDLLLALGERLEQELVISSFLVAGLRDSGVRTRIEPDARMRHFDRTEWSATLRVFAIVGTGFGALRTRSWPVLGRALFPLATPYIALRHWLRGVREYRRAGRENGLRLSCLVASVPLAIAWAAGEAVGALAGPERVAPWIWRSEVKPVSAEMVRVVDAVANG